MQSWFAIHARAQKEELAARELERMGFEVFWPHTTHWVGTGHKAKSRLLKRSWLSRYLFVRTFKENLWAVNNSPGVSTVVSAPGGDPFPISEKVMKDLMERAGELGKVYAHQTKEKFSGNIGDIVKGIEGWPIWGLAGEISKVCGDEVAIKMVMFGSEREVVVPADAVELSKAG